MYFRKKILFFEYVCYNLLFKSVFNAELHLVCSIYNIWKLYFIKNI